MSYQYCKKCNAEMKLVNRGERSPVYKCQPCHTKAVREKYSKSRDEAAIRWRLNNPEKYKVMRAKNAIKLCGVASYTSVVSKRSEKTAHNARQRWTIAGDELVLSLEFTESQLAKMLGRSIRSIQRRKNRLREEIKKGIE